MKKELSQGLVTLAAENKSLIKRALLCRTGKFDGMFGPVVVDEELLNKICDLYKKSKEKPVNENDFAPILIDHNRSAELVRGRLLAEGMEVDEWKEIDGKMEMGLYGDLRVDNEDAKSKVEAGQYAQLSISFDEETGELFEVSFVAVEAARGAMILSQGGNVGTEAKLAKASQKVTNLAKHMQDTRKTRKANLAKLVSAQTALMAEIQGLQKQSETISLAVKAGQVKGRMAEFVRAGKMTPVEFKKLDFKAISLMNESTLKILTESFEAREVSSDVVQHGQVGGKGPTALKAGDHEATRKAIELQKSGKGGTVVLAEDDKGDGEGKGDPADEKKEKGALSALDHEEYSKCMEEMSGLHSKLSECVDKMKGLAEDSKKMSDDEDGDEKKEKDMAADEPEDKSKKQGDE